MRNTPDHSPLDSYAKTLFEQYAAHSECGIAIRCGDARLRLQEILQVESAVKQQEAINAQITDKLVRQQAEHELNMQYLIQFGVRADERTQFRELLEQAAEHGGLSLREAANLTHAMSQRNGSEDPSTSMLVLSGFVE